jgi:hypothetical protein
VGGSQGLLAAGNRISSTSASVGARRPYTRSVRTVQRRDCGGTTAPFLCATASRRRGGQAGQGDSRRTLEHELRARPRRWVRSSRQAPAGRSSWAVRSSSVITSHNVERRLPVRRTHPGGLQLAQQGKDPAIAGAGSLGDRACAATRPSLGQQPLELVGQQRRARPAAPSRCPSRRDGLARRQESTGTAGSWCGRLASLLRR